MEMPSQRDVRVIEGSSHWESSVSLSPAHSTIPAVQIVADATKRIQAPATKATKRGEEEKQGGW